LRAHRIRKQLGGGMRQAGILAAAGIVALETMVERLGEDHERARQLARGLSEIPGINLDPNSPQTNMVFLSLDERLPLNAKMAAAKLAEQRVYVGVIGERRFRLVTHYWIDDEAIADSIKAFETVMQ
jgi:threonine aldolase